VRYTETVTRFLPSAREESIEVPEELVKLVNSNDPQFGRNGILYMGCQRKRQGGHTIDRLYEYANHHRIYHEQYGHPCNCPVSLKEEGDD